MKGIGGLSSNKNADNLKCLLARPALQWLTAGAEIYAGILFFLLLLLNVAWKNNIGPKERGLELFEGLGTRTTLLIYEKQWVIFLKADFSRN